MSAPTAASPPLPLRHCYWVVPGLLLAGEHPNGPTRDKTKDRLKKLLAAGIECFVDLTKPTELLRYDTHLPFYVEYARKAIKDHGLPGSRAQMTEILDYIANSMRAGRPLYVHCRAGIGRTGTVVGCLLVERGLTGTAALDELNRLWQQCRRSKSWAFIPETDAQATYIREWRPTLEGGGFELSSLATAVATVGPMTSAGSIRPGVLSVADVQARAASQATGAGQARAAVENLAAGKGRSGLNSSAGYVGGGGLSAAAEHARAAVERGEAPPTNTGAALSPMLSASANPSRSLGTGPSRGAPASQVLGSGPSAAPGRASGSSPPTAPSRALGSSATAAPGHASGQSPTAAPGHASGQSPTAAPGRAPGQSPTTAPSHALGSSPTAAPSRASGSSPPTAPSRALGSSPPTAPSHALGSSRGGGLDPASGSTRTAGSSHPSTWPGQVSGSGQDAGYANDFEWNPAAVEARDELERGEISPSIRAEIADAIAGRNPPAKPDSGVRMSAGPSVGNGNAVPNAGSEAEPSRANLSTGAGSLGGSAVSSGPAAVKPVNGGRNAGSVAGNAEGETASSRAGTGDDRRSTGGMGTGDHRRSSGGTGAGDNRRNPGSIGAGDGRLSPSGAGGSDDRPSHSDAARFADTKGAPATSRAGAADMRADATLANGAAPNANGARPVNPSAAPDPLAPQPSFTTRAPAAVRTPAGPSVGSDPLLDPDTLAAARGLRERFVGTLFGLAVGDAVAAATQFRRPGSFSPVGDMIGGGPFDLPRGAWSDDTAMALCLAESLLERDGFDARDQVQRYSRWQQEGYLSSTGQCVGITANTARSLALAKWRRVVFPGSHDPEQLDPEPLSRVASVALFYFASVETTLVQAADSSRTTCQAPAVLDACRRLGRALNAALSGQPKTMILAEVGAITDAAAQSNNTAATALAAALWAFSSTDNFRDAVLRAANVGGNSDVVACVCGQLAGAHYGATAIPPSWRNGLMQKDLIEGYADRLLAHGLVSLSNG